MGSTHRVPPPSKPLEAAANCDVPHIADGSTITSPAGSAQGPVHSPLGAACTGPRSGAQSISPCATTPILLHSVPTERLRGTPRPCAGPWGHGAKPDAPLPSGGGLSAGRRRNTHAQALMLNAGRSEEPRGWSQRPSTRRGCLSQGLQEGTAGQGSWVGTSPICCRHSRGASVGGMESGGTTDGCRLRGIYLA